MSKTKIVFEQCVMANGKYKVVHLTNRTRPLINELLTEDEVNKLKAESADLTIEIRPYKN